MHKRTKRSKLSPGRRERASNGDAFAWQARGIAFVAKHLTWARAIAKRFGLQNAQRGFAKAKLTDLAILELIRRQSRMAIPGSRYDQRQWVRNEFKNVVLQQFFETRPVVGSDANNQPLQESHRKADRIFCQPVDSRSVAPIAPLAKQLLRANGIVRRTGQIESVELPLILAGSRLNRPAGAGSVAFPETDEAIRIGMPVAKLARRHQRVEIAREPAAKESGTQSSVQTLQSPMLAMERSIAPIKVRKQQRMQEQEPIEIGVVPLRGMNVTQVADEVMKQLDRRLIAARERMGKI